MRAGPWSRGPQDTWCGGRRTGDQHLAPSCRLPLRACGSRDVVWVWSLLRGEGCQPLPPVRESWEHWARQGAASRLEVVGFGPMRQGPDSAGSARPARARTRGVQPGALPASQSQASCHIPCGMTGRWVCFVTTAGHRGLLRALPKPQKRERWTL